MEKLNEIFAKIFELNNVLYLSDFSDAMFDNSLYFSIGIFLFFAALLLSLVYYFVINRADFSKFRHWITSNVVNSLITVIFAIIVSLKKFKLLDLTFTFDKYFTFFSIVFVVAFLFFFLFSVLMKRFSKQSSETPFKTIIKF